MKRKSGVLMPVSSLPSPYGIGAFSKEAYKFVDFLAEAGQTYWQMLPLGQTGYGDSPYQSFSTFAGNPYFIDLDQLVEAGYLEAGELAAADFGADPEHVSYDKIYSERFRILRMAYHNSPYALQVAERWAGYKEETAAFEAFIEKYAAWLPDYALYSAIKNAFGGKSLSDWEDDIRLRRPAAMEAYQAKLEDEVRFYEFQQYLFRQQWSALKQYANEKGIQMIGDVPIYVASDSADAWAHPELFQLDEHGRPSAVAGCPPDGFSATGQLWGNPLERLAACFELYDIVRIDHFRGFDEYFAIPYGDTTAANGKWMPGPGMDIMNAIKERFGDRPIIAEDLGFLTPTVLQLVKDTGYPGMKLLQFAFDSREPGDYLPHNYPHNCVLYTGTHDNDTVMGWKEHVSAEDLDFTRRYLNIHPGDALNWAMIRAAFASVADTVIIPMQDYLGLGSEARINTPSTLGRNWQWRMKPDAIAPELAGRIRELTELYGRM